MAVRLDGSSICSTHHDSECDHLLIHSRIPTKSAPLRCNVRRSPVNCCGHPYQVQYIQSKGAFLVVMWGFLSHAVIPIATSVHLLHLSLNALRSKDKSHLPNYFDQILYAALFILYPVMGWIADAKIGRYKALQYGIVSIFIASLCMILGYIFHIITLRKDLDSLQVPVAVLLGIGVFLNISGFACFDANVIPFLTDQVLGASGENLSALIHWYFWFSALADGINTIVEVSLVVFREPYLTLGILIVHFLCVLTVLVSCFQFKHWLDTTPQITNPIKLIVKVLKYAFHNTYPKNRSALTYWEEVSPSRVDLGKEKYGGPFSEEEVEDVKTSLRLLPLVFLSVGINLTASPFEYTKKLHQPMFNSSNTWYHIGMDLIESNAMYYSTLLFTFVILFHTVIYPCFYRHIPTILKRIGFGLILSVISLLYLTVLDMTAQTAATPDQSSICLLLNITNIDELSVSFYWGLPEIILKALGELFVAPFATEFIIAQTPGPMKGFMIGLWFFFFRAIESFGTNIYYAFEHIQGRFSLLTCTFYYFSTKALICFVMTLLFVRFAYRYKMRTRNIPINFNVIAENHYEKYLDLSSSNTISSSYDSA